MVLGGRIALGGEVGFIYALYDSSRSEFLDQTRYVGKTTKTVQERLDQHIWHARKAGTTYRDKWIRYVEGHGRFIIGKPIVQVPDEDLDIQESYWINLCRRLDCGLTNAREGGEGGAFAWTDDMRRKLSESGRRLWSDPEYRQRMSEAHRGTNTGPRSPQVGINISKAKKGRSNGRVKITETMLAEIRGRYEAGGVTLRALGAEYGVGHSAISHRLRFPLAGTLPEED